MTEVTLAAPVTSASPPMLAHLQAFLSCLHTICFSLPAHLDMLFKAVICAFNFSTLITHKPLAAKMGYFHMIL